VSVKLTTKQRRFVEEYLIDGNATGAAIRAGYSPKTARAIGSENLRKPDIAAAVAAAKQRVAAQIEISRDEVERRLAAIGFARVPEKKIRPGDIRRALVDLAKMCGWWRERVEVEAGPSMYDVLMDIHNSHGDEASRLRRMSAAAIQDECRTLHGGRCASLEVHAEALMLPVADRRPLFTECERLHPDPSDRRPGGRCETARLHRARVDAERDGTVTPPAPAAPRVEGDALVL
jgi:hypothetical protein